MATASTPSSPARRSPPSAGKFLARGGKHVQLEGNDRARNVVVEFPDLATAEACYRSPAYQEALSHAQGASTRDLVLVEGA